VLNNMCHVHINNIRILLCGCELNFVEKYAQGYIAVGLHRLRSTITITGQYCPMNYILWNYNDGIW